jgi:shikimate kinase / 3-dehydroquinate synthase
LATLSGSPRRALVFIGFMGAGKSKAALAARRAGLETVDADRELERDLGRPIAEFFAGEGEEEFRRREADYVVELLEGGGADAIALGGGAVLSDRVRAALRGHAVVWLDVDAETAWGRVEGSSRPLARERERFLVRHAERAGLYESVADAIVPGHRAVVERSLDSLIALRSMPVGTRMAWAESESGGYPAYVGRGLLGVGRLRGPGRAFLVTDSVVGELYAEAAGPVDAVIEVAAGERSKTLTEAERVLRELTAAGATRSDHVVALGGGVVGDLAGFCAAVYQRGIPVVQVPTTLVGQVDSAYGGKTGVDLPEAKNYVGAYHLPAAVLADPATLSTLPPAELAAGFVEVLKTALIAGGGLWERVRALETLEPRLLDPLIFACVRTKLAVVAADERDRGLRQVLNLGHTVGHAIEAASGYGRYRHGEAVGLGLLAALELSDAGDLRDEVEAILERHSLPTRIDPAIAVDAVIDAVGRDKKRTPGGVGFVLCRAPGEVVTDQRVEPDVLRAAVERLYDR